MAMPCTAQPKRPLHERVSAPLETRVSLPPAALPQLEELWYFECVVRPHSHAARDAKLSSAPSAKFPWGSSCHSAASPYDHSHAVTSHKDSPVLQVNDHSEDSVKRALQRVFNTFDENGDGKVSVHEISGMFEKLGIKSSTESLLATLVTHSDGHVDEQEFLSLYESICTSDASATSSSPQTDVEQDLLDAFNVFDKDGNGFISPAELQSVLCSLGFPQGRQLEACVDMIAKVDENGDGLVDFFEFKKLFDAEDPFILIPCY